MGYKELQWKALSYQRKGNILVIQVNDEFGKRIDEFRGKSQKDYKIISKILKKKYGIDLTPEVKWDESINMNKEKKGFLDKDLDW